MQYYEAGKYFLPVLDHNQISFLVGQKAFFQHAQHHPRQKFNNLDSNHSVIPYGH